MNVDYANKKISYVRNNSEEIETISYDVLINSSPIDLFVENTQICPSLNISHNKVIHIGFLSKNSLF